MLEQAGSVGTRGLVAAWRRDLERRGLMASTLRLKVRHLTALAAVVDLLTATTDDLEAFLDRRAVASGTRSSWLTSFAGFYAWARRAGHVTIDPTLDLARPRRRRYLPRPISDDHLALALRESTGDMHLWLTLMAFAGLRCAEVAALERGHLAEIDGRAVLVVRGKGDRERIVPAHPLVVAAVAAWPRDGRMRRADGTPVGAGDVSWRTRAFLHSLGIDASGHQLHHWFGTRTYAESHDLRVVQELLGHASPATTAVYTQWSQRVATEAVSRLALPAA